MDAWTALASGFSTGSALIVAIGAQNAFVLRQGLRREHVRLVVAICVASDAVLIQIGTRGVGAAVALHPSIDLAMRCLGALWLAVYGLLAVRRASSPAMLQTATSGSASDWPRVAITTLALTWLNPHVYLDTVLLIGAIAAERAGDLRQMFGIGATVASVAWFAGLGYGARWLAPWFRRPAAWRLLDAAVALVMFSMASKLLAPLLPPLLAPTPD
jgi:L-lysine exporter family protein LysE/ArgO